MSINPPAYKDLNILSYETSDSLIQRVLKNMSPEDLMASAMASNIPVNALKTWRAIARPQQLEQKTDTPWAVWIIIAGRGFGKTRTGAEWVIEKAQQDPGCRIALIGATAGDTRKTMVWGNSGIMNICPKHFLPKVKEDEALTFPNGSKAFYYSAIEPERLRGPEHHYAWGDEVRAWRYSEAHDMMLLGLRLGNDPRALYTTTPRPVKWLKDLLAQKDTIITYGTTYDNQANLPEKYFNSIIKRFENTRIGRQELLALMLEDNPDALWTQAIIDRNRVKHNEVPELVKIVVAIDPAVTSNKESAETGIIGIGKAVNGHLYLLDDRTLKAKPKAWADASIKLFRDLQANWIIGEVNNGGDLVEANIQSVDETIPYKAVRATRGKQVRAEPISSLYERDMVHHVGNFPLLEEQMTNWNPSDPSAPSPDRMDALVWGATELMGPETIFVG